MEKGNTGFFSKIKIGQKMLWIKSKMEILQSRMSLAVVAGMKKMNDQAEPTKVAC